MSKAFTKEDDTSDVVVIRDPPQLAPGEKRYITPEGYRAIESLAARLAKERPDDPRIKLLRATLAVLTVLPPSVQEKRVSFGAWVTVEDEEGMVKSYRIVGPDEADAKAGLISMESPLARALMRKEEGDSVTFKRPLGTTELSIVRVSADPP